MGVKVESLILQISAERDWSDKERELSAQGMLPVVVFANGPEHPYLLAARLQDLEASFALSAELAEGLGAERLAKRMRVFESLAFAIETDMKYVQDQSEFPNDAMFLLVEALHQYGFDDPSQLRPCAVRYLRSALDDPDFGEPPPPEEGSAPNGAAH